jgi:hypothetical protein
MRVEIVIAIVAAMLTAIGVAIAYMQLRRASRPVDAPSSVTDTIEVVIDHSEEAQPSRIEHNLPPREQFIGRDAEKNRLFEGLRSGFPLIALEGLGGMGKTALAKEAAWLCATGVPEQLSSKRRPFDAVVWTEDRDGTLTLNELLDTIATVLGYPIHSIAANAGEAPRGCPHPSECRLPHRC